MKQDHKTLTAGETQVMNLLWSMPKSQARSAELMAAHPTPKPALTTLLTFLKILKQKGFVKTRKEQGKPTLFMASVSKEQYTGSFLHAVKDTLFDGSFSSLVSAFAAHETLTEQDIQELKALVGKLTSNP